jgi:hypothetical protein
MPALVVFFALIAFASSNKEDGGPLFSFFEKHSKIRRVVRGACALVGLEREFDKRFGGPIFYVRFTH